MVVHPGASILRPEQLPTVRGETTAGAAAAADGDQAVPEGFLSP